MCYKGEDGVAGCAAIGQEACEGTMDVANTLNEGNVREFEEARNALIVLDKFMARYMNRIDADPQLGNILFQTAFDSQPPIDINEISTHTKASLRTSHLLMRLVISDAIGVFKINSGMVSSGTVRDVVRENTVRVLGTESITNPITREAQSLHLDRSMQCGCNYQSYLAFGDTSQPVVPDISVPTWDEVEVADVVLSGNQGTANYRGEGADIDALNAAKDRAESK